MDLAGKHRCMQPLKSRSVAINNTVSHSDGQPMHLSRGFAEKIILPQKC